MELRRCNRMQIIMINKQEKKLIEEINLIYWLGSYLDFRLCCPEFCLYFSAIFHKKLGLEPLWGSVWDCCILYCLVAEVIVALVVRVVIIGIEVELENMLELELNLLRRMYMDLFIVCFLLCEKIRIKKDRININMFWNN